MSQSQGIFQKKGREERQTLIHKTLPAVDRDSKIITWHHWGS